MRTVGRGDTLGVIKDRNGVIVDDYARVWLLRQYDFHPINNGRGKGCIGYYMDIPIYYGIKDKFQELKKRLLE